MSLLFLEYLMALKRAVKMRNYFAGGGGGEEIYLEVVYLVTALVPSETACLASSPGSKSLTAVWTSRLVMVDFLL